jgi:transcription elongation factor Elf1
MIKEKLFDKRIFCCNCDDAYKSETMFIKQYNNTAICLCKKCAKELVNEINERYKKEDTK